MKLEEAVRKRRSIRRFRQSPVSGEQIKASLEGYLKVLYDANPKAVGGKLPGDDFYSLEF